MVAPPIAPSSIHHIAIQCVDLDAMVEFYQTVLCLRVVRRWPSDQSGMAGDRSVWLATGNSIIALERCLGEVDPRPWNDDRPGLHLLALQIFRDNRDAWCQWLDHCGVEIKTESSWTVYIVDPEGNRIGLSHFPDAARAVAT
jgi:catechol 2,3-dioxygenase-like lactoylglutathione lyase family enzyme